MITAMVRPVSFVARCWSGSRQRPHRRDGGLFCKGIHDGGESDGEKNRTGRALTRRVVPRAEPPAMSRELAPAAEESQAHYQRYRTHCSA